MSELPTPPQLGGKGTYGPEGIGADAEFHAELEGLAADLLAMYARASRLGQMSVAEELLCALEQLAKSDASFEDAVTEAYAYIPALCRALRAGGSR